MQDESITLILTMLKKFHTDGFPGFFALFYQHFRKTLCTSLVVSNVMNDADNFWLSNLNCITRFKCSDAAVLLNQHKTMARAVHCH
jgi:hypothetical protein